MIAHFDTLEADFQREYGINLGTDVWAMSWRRFQVLIRGLSARSGWAALSRVKAKRRRIRGKAVDDYFASIGA